MYNTVIGVGAAVLAGGVALYTGYELLNRDEPETPRIAEVAEAASDRTTRRADAARTAGRGGVPDSERALDFAEGAAGERIERTGADTAAEAERLAALGSGGVVEELDEAGVAASEAADRDDFSADLDAARFADATPGARADLRDAVDTDLGRASGRDALGSAPNQDALGTASDQDAGTRVGDGVTGQDAASRRGGLRGAVTAGQEATPRVAEAPDAPARVQTARNAAQTDKPDTARNRRLTDKPDTQLARLVDKPDDSPYFAATDETRDFDPCTKADGTPYVGPGTAINPFADGDPCLPRATGQAFEVAMAPAGPFTPVTTSSLGGTAPRILPFVDLVSPGFVAAPPVGGNFGSDYAQ